MSDRIDPNAVPELSDDAKRDLRARAQHLSAVAQIGQAGVTAPVLTAVNRALREHEVVKVRLQASEGKQAIAEALAEATRAALCGVVGQAAILFKPRSKAKASKLDRLG